MLNGYYNIILKSMNNIIIHSNKSHAEKQINKEKLNCLTTHLLSLPSKSNVPKVRRASTVLVTSRESERA